MSSYVLLQIDLLRFTYFGVASWSLWWVQLDFDDVSGIVCIPNDNNEVMISSDRPFQDFYCGEIISLFCPLILRFTLSRSSPVPGKNCPKHHPYAFDNGER